MAGLLYLYTSLQKGGWPLVSLQKSSDGWLASWVFTEVFRRVAGLLCLYRGLWKGGWPLVSLQKSSDGWLASCVFTEVFRRVDS